MSTEELHRAVDATLDVAEAIEAGRNLSGFGLATAAYLRLVCASIGIPSARLDPVRQSDSEAEFWRRQDQMAGGK